MSNKNTNVCQSCKLHSNKPSYCGVRKHHVPRKMDACEEYQQSPEKARKMLEGNNHESPTD